MRFPELSQIDRTLAVGVGISLMSLGLLVVGLFSIITVLTDDPAGLPAEGSIEDILAGAEDGPPAAGASATPIPQGPRPTRLGIPRIYIDAPVAATGFEPGTDTPDVPDRADLIAWYDFTPTPGMGSNAVFSGHVDWQTPDGSPIPGVFYRLRELKIGDSLIVKLDDKRTLEYRVTGNIASDYDDPKLVRLMGSTKKDVITLITCGGTWITDRSKENGGNYSHRVLVRAELIPAPAAAAISP